MTAAVLAEAFSPIRLTGSRVPMPVMPVMPGIAGIGAGAASTITGLNADMAFGGTIQINATGGAGGTKDSEVNRAQGGTGVQGSDGGSAAAGGNGGDAVVTVANSTLTAGRSLAIHLSAEGGQGGDAANEAAGGRSQIVNNGFNGAAANGGDAGNATAILNNNVIAVGTSSQNGIVTLDAEVRTYSASQGSLEPNSTTAIDGSPGATAPGHITFTNNTVTLGAGSGFEKGAALTLELSDTVLATSHEGPTTTDGQATDTLNAGAGGNLDFSGNSFDGGGGGELTLMVAGGGATADLLDNTISIGGSVDNALIGFSTVILDSGDTFIAGRDNEVIEINQTGDTVEFTAESGNLEIFGNTSTLVTGGSTIDFAGFGPGLDAAAIAADTSVVNGNTLITIGGQTLEILGFTGNASSIETFTSLTALTQIAVTVAQMQGFETSHTLPAAGSTYIVTDTAANIEAATAAQIRGFAAPTGRPAGGHGQQRDLSAGGGRPRPYLYADRSGLGRPRDLRHRPGGTGSDGQASAADDAAGRADGARRHGVLVGQAHVGGAWRCHGHQRRRQADHRGHAGRLFRGQ